MTKIITNHRGGAGLSRRKFLVNSAAGVAAVASLPIETEGTQLGRNQGDKKTNPESRITPRLDESLSQI